MRPRVCPERALTRLQPDIDGEKAYFVKLQSGRSIRVRRREDYGKRTVADRAAQMKASELRPYQAVLDVYLRLRRGRESFGAPSPADDEDDEDDEPVVVSKPRAAPSRRVVVAIDSTEDEADDEPEPEPKGSDAGSFRASATPEDDDDDEASGAASSDDQRRPTRTRGGRGRRAASPEVTRRSTRKGRHQDRFVNEERAMALADESDERTSESTSSGDAAPKTRGAKKAKASVARAVMDIQSAATSALADLPAHRRPRSTRSICEDAPADALMARAQARKKRRKDEEEAIEALGAWITCAHCIFAAHFGCLAKTTQADITRSLKARARADGEAKMAVDGDDSDAEPSARELDIAEALSLPECPHCARPSGRVCLECSHEQRVVDGEAGVVAAPSDDALLFRCVTCARAAHYACLPLSLDDEDEEHGTPGLEDIANSYDDISQCTQCGEWGDEAIEGILAWRPIGLKEDDPVPEKWETPSVKDLHAPVEYYGASVLLVNMLTSAVKLLGSSYGNCVWMPHAYGASSALMAALTLQSSRLPRASTSCASTSSASASPRRR